MFERLKDNLLKGQGREKVISRNQSKEALESNVLKEEILDVSWKNNVFFMDIMTDCTIEEYCDYLNEKNIEKPAIPLRLLLMSGHNFLTARLKRQSVCIFEQSNANYLISVSFDNINLSERRVIENLVHETVIRINYRDNNYEYVVEKYVHDLNGSTKLCKWYPMKSYRDDYFLLDKNEALILFRDILASLESVEEINELLNKTVHWNLSFIYGILNNELFKRVIENNSNDCSSEIINSKKVRVFEKKN